MEKREKIFFSILLALIFLIYGNSLFGGFVFDDRGILEHQGLLSSLANLGEVAAFPYWTIDAGLYRPVTLLSYAFNIIFLGGSAFSFHLVNLLLYFAICALIFVLIKRMFSRERLAILTAILFLILPIHSEVVANITGRSELLALLFSLLVLLEFSKEKINFWLAGIWIFLALGAKETAIAVLPLILLIILIRERKVSWALVHKYFRSVSAAVIGTGVYFFLRFFVLGPEHFLGIETSLIENPLLFENPINRAATALEILWMYVSKSFWPANLCSDYSYNQIQTVSGFLHLKTLLGLSILGASFVSIFAFWKRRPIVSFASAIFFFSFLPVSNILFPIGTIAGERLFFYASFGLVLIVALLLDKLTQKALMIIGAIIIVLYGSIAFHRSALWMSEEKLFLNAVQCAPQSVLSLSNVGAVHYLSGQLEKAKYYLERSREIKPIYSKGLNNLGLVYWKQGNDRDALRLYHEALLQKYPYSGAIENIILLSLSEGDEAQALRWLRIMYPNVDDSVLRNQF